MKRPLRPEEVKLWRVVASTAHPLPGRALPSAPPVKAEAPTKASQFALLDHFGREVHLCNVRLEELLRVEIYRRGLHSDAFGKEKLRPERPAP